MPWRNIREGKCLREVRRFEFIVKMLMWETNNDVSNQTLYRGSRCTLEKYKERAMFEGSIRRNVRFKLIVKMLMWLANNGVSNQTLNKETLCLGKIYTGREMFEGRK